MNISLWEEDFDEYFIGEVDLKQMEKVQEELKLVLPSSYVELMKQRNCAEIIILIELTRHLEEYCFGDFIVNFWNIY